MPDDMSTVYQPVDFCIPIGPIFNFVSGTYQFTTPLDSIYIHIDLVMCLFTVCFIFLFIALLMLILHNHLLIFLCISSLILNLHPDLLQL